MQPIQQKGFGMISLIILVILGIGIEILFISNHQKSLSAITSLEDRKFSLSLLFKTPSPKLGNSSRGKITPKATASQSQSNQHPVFSSNTVQVVSEGYGSQSVPQANYQLTTILFCSNSDPQVSSHHLDMEIGFSAQDQSKPYYYVMITENASGKTVYGPYTGGDPGTSASYDAIYHGSVSGFFTNTPDLIFAGDGSQYTVKLYKSNDPLINGSVVKQVTVSKTCN